jgi:hypothetical protein
LTGPAAIAHPGADENAASAKVAVLSSDPAKMPAGTEHFAVCKNECVLQVHAIGSFEMKYVNPADDPRGAKK